MTGTDSDLIGSAKGKADPAAAKDALRRRLRSSRRAFALSLSGAEREAALNAAAGHAAPLIEPHARVGIYVPTRYEIDPAPCAAHVTRRLLLPWFGERTSPMQFREAGPLFPGPWKMMQPAHTAAAGEPEILLVPLLAATSTGDRLGQGGGHYDRYLAARQAAGTLPLTIGLAWDCQMVPALPREPWDHLLDYIVTPSALYGPHG